MGKFDKMLICTDLDGTLLKNDKTISKENYDAIEYFKKEGGLFTFVTGRVPLTSIEIYDMVKPNIAYGCINGGGVYDQKKAEYMWLHPIEREVLEIVEYVDKTLPEVGIQLNTVDALYICKDNLSMVEFRNITKTPNIESHYNDVNETLVKIIFSEHREEEMQKLMRTVENHKLASKYHLVRSERRLFEILPKGISKATSLDKLVEIYNLDINKTIAVGDYYNDVEMIRHAKVGVAVSNACEEAKKAADIVTVSNEDSAIARIIEGLENGTINL